MSWWTHIRGTVEVTVPGRTQAEIDYILQTVLDHLPRVTGSEGDMEIHIVRHDGSRSSLSCDEFEMRTNNLVDIYGNKSNRGWLETQDTYSLVLVGDLRDRFFKETYREFMKWLCRLSKRLCVESVLVNINGYDRSIINGIDEKSVTIDENAWDNPYYKMYEYPSWVKDSDGEPAWWEYLMWKRWEDSPLPIEHIVKYYDVEEADKEFFKQE